MPYFILVFFHADHVTRLGINQDNDFLKRNGCFGMIHYCKFPSGSNHNIIGLPMSDKFIQVHDLASYK